MEVYGGTKRSVGHAEGRITTCARRPCAARHKSEVRSVDETCSPTIRSDLLGSADHAFRLNLRYWRVPITCRLNRDQAHSTLLRTAPSHPETERIGMPDSARANTDYRAWASSPRSAMI